jgi:hypothetical protein
MRRASSAPLLAPVVEAQLLEVRDREPRCKPRGVDADLLSTRVILLDRYNRGSASIVDACVSFLRSCPVARGSYLLCQRVGLVCDDAATAVRNRFLLPTVFYKPPPPTWWYQEEGNESTGCPMSPLLVGHEWR